MKALQITLDHSAKEQLKVVRLVRYRRLKGITRVTSVSEHCCDFQLNEERTTIYLIDKR